MSCIDMDYRGSEGYGRDWRTAIYRDMGHPELEDLLDGKAWLVKNYHVDPARVGIYGGSYGGFMTEMAMLRAPGPVRRRRRAASAGRLDDLQRRVHLRHPQQPAAGPRGLQAQLADRVRRQPADPLLICHGLIDNNVMPTDSIRLYQRFIELHKHNFWLSLYPMERHGFVHADSWRDEYTRIHDLFTRYVLNRSPSAAAP